MLTSAAEFTVTVPGGGKGMEGTTATFLPSTEVCCGDPLESANEVVRLEAAGMAAAMTDGSADRSTMLLSESTGSSKAPALLSCGTGGSAPPRRAMEFVTAAQF
mmetsp:Transcript_24954/g.57963  ORF Transcript_24954/g.57963 Transcript_24954/m.57963 type:complete len:104 (+) Transcript_24954:32-343(+)